MPESKTKKLDALGLVAFIGTVGGLIVLAVSLPDPQQSGPVMISGSSAFAVAMLTWLGGLGVGLSMRGGHDGE